MLILTGIAFTSPLHRWADSSTYFLQILSIANDHDIHFAAEDYKRATENKFDDLPAGLYLIKINNQQYIYGKEFSYALFSAPFYKLFGKQGILLFNALLFFLMILMGYLFLRKNNNPFCAVTFASLYFLLSSSFLYMFWIHPEVYTMFLVMSGLYFFCLFLEKNKIYYIGVSAFIFGLACVAKITNVTMFFTVILILSVKYSKKRLVPLAVSLFLFIVPLLLFYSYFYLHANTIFFYGGNRLYYTTDFPFSNTNHLAQNNAAVKQDSSSPEDFERGQPAFSLEYGRKHPMLNINTLNVVARNSLYYFIGRFSGLTWYYPFAFIALIMFLIKLRNIPSLLKNNAPRVGIFLGIVCNIAIFLFFVPNYWGGSHAVGNRYFYIYPAFLFLIEKIDLKRISFFTLLASITTFFYITQPFSTSSMPIKHSYNFPFKYFPIEYTLLNDLSLPHHEIGGLTWYPVDNNATFSSDDALILRGNAELLATSPRSYEFVDIAFISLADHNAIQATCYNKKIAFTLHKNESRIITFSNLKSVYSYEHYRVDKFIFAAEGAIWVKPIRAYNKQELSLYYSVYSAQAPLDYLKNWYDREKWGDTITTRWMSNNGYILFYTPIKGAVTLQFKALSFHAPRKVDIFLNNILISQISVTPQFREYAIPLTLSTDKNVIMFNSPNEALRPCDIIPLNNNDPRPLSIAIQKLSIK